MGSFCNPAGGIAVWNPGIFLARYPEFTAAYTANNLKFQGYFTEAGLYLSNSPNSPVRDVAIRLMLLNMLVAHISFLAGDLNATVTTAIAPASVVIQVAASAPGNFSVPHGLGTVPTSMEILATSAGTIWAQTPAYDATNVYLAASETGVTAAVSVFVAGQITSTSSGQEARPVGRVNNATEGSVSASFDYTGPTPGSGPWFNQDQYGAAFWQATSKLRSFRYVAGASLSRPRGYCR